MAFSRRKFLERCAGWLGAAPMAMAGAARVGAARPIGLQLYTVRGLLARDFGETLRAVRELGYEDLEFAGLHGRAASEVRRILDDLGLAASSGHYGLDELRRRQNAIFDESASLGATWVVCPWIDREDRTPDGYQRVAARFNRIGRAARAAGLRFAYHNHDFELARLADGRRGYDILLAECDRELVAMEMDLYWMVAGGGDPLAYFDRHPGRFPLVHVKDRTAAGEMVNVGKGTIDFAAIFARSRQAGIEHYYVEHDQPAAPLPDLRESIAAMRRLLA